MFVVAERQILTGEFANDQSRCAGSNLAFAKLTKRGEVDFVNAVEWRGKIGNVARQPCRGECCTCVICFMPRLPYG